MTTESKDQQEPSMEEILSSIRRIIADEEAEDGRSEEDPELGAAEAAGADEPGEDDEEDEDDVLELTKVVRDSGEVVDLHADQEAEDAPSEDESGAAAAIEEQPPVEGVAEEPADEMEAAEPEDEPSASGEDDFQPEEQTTVPVKQAADPELVSDAAASAATGAFAKLTQAYQRTPAEESVAESDGRSVEQFIEDMIRPMLKQWLDDNLSRVVEKKVEREIQKIARRADLI